MSEELKQDEFIIRNFKPEDFSDVLKLWEETGLGGAHRGDTLEIILQTIQHGGTFLILENISNKDIVGTAWITNDYRRLYLHHFGIAPAYQGKGLAHVLANACISFGKKNNLQMKLEVHRENKKARNLYLKHGFRDLGDYEVMIIRKYEEI
ncbi:MAG: GNAT family N-acetyltransferase [Bacteroidales bacterium]